MLEYDRGEKIHEVLCPVSTAHLTLDFKDHLILLPTVNLDKNYLINNKKKKGQPVKKILFTHLIKIKIF